MKRVISLAALLAATLALAACSQAAAPSTPPATETPEWPRTIEIPAYESQPASTLTLEAAPKRIAALDYESAEVLAELDLEGHLVLIPEAVLNPALGSHVEELSKVENTFPVAMEVDAETVIALAPDLVIMSPRHGNEQNIAAVLGEANVPTLQLPSPWISPELTISNIELIGKATGSERAATELITELETGLSAATVTASDTPRVLLLTNQAGRPFITAGKAYPVELLGLAGAQSVSADLGIERTGPISAEQIVEANPDGVVLIDMNGTGDRMFTELLANPAVSSLPGFAAERVLRAEGKDVQALGLTETVDGLETLAGWVATLR